MLLPSQIIEPEATSRHNTFSQPVQASPRAGAGEKDGRVYGPSTNNISVVCLTCYDRPECQVRGVRERRSSTREFGHRGCCFCMHE